MQRRDARFVKSRYGRHSRVSEMLNELGWPPLLKGDMRRDSFFSTKFSTVRQKFPSKVSLLRLIRVQEINK